MYTSKSWSHALNFSYVYIWITFIRQEKNRQKTQQVSKTNIESISILIDFFSEFIWFFRCFGAKKKIIFDYYECRIMCHTRHSPFKKSKRERKKIWKIYQIIFVIEIKAHTFHSTSDPLIFSDVDFFFLLSKCPYWIANMTNVIANNFVEFGNDSNESWTKI